MEKLSVGRLFLERVELSANDNAIGKIENGAIAFITYKDYKKVIAALSRGFVNLGMTTGMKVSILATTSIEWHYSDLAIMCGRGVTVPIYPNYLPDEIEYILAHSEAQILVVEDSEQLKKVVPVLTKVNVKTIVYLKEINDDLKSKLPSDVNLKSFAEVMALGKEDLKSSPNAFEKNINDSDPNELASIIYTSGTTGEPKGAVITNHGFAKMFRNVQQAFKGTINRQDRSLTFLPLSHVFGRMDSLLPIVFGWECVYAESLDKVIENLAVAKPTFMCAVPRIFEKIYAKVKAQIEESSPIKKKIFAWADKVSTQFHEKLQQDISPSPLEIAQHKLAFKLVFSKIYNRFGGRVRFFLSGGAPISTEIIRFLRNANLTILEGYGLTETIAPCTANPISKQIPGTVGLPIGDVQLKIADDGEILIKTDAMLKEYYKRPDETAKSIIDGWFYTGDIGEISTNGHLKITDRKKEIIITSGGKNVAPQKIENMMKTQRWISQFCVIGEKKKYLAAVVGIEKETFQNVLHDLGLGADCSLKELAENPKVKEWIEADIKKVNQDLASFETIKKFYVAPIEFSVDEGLVTPSLKIKRKVINERFQNEINAMY